LNGNILHSENGCVPPGIGRSNQIAGIGVHIVSYSYLAFLYGNKTWLTVEIQVLTQLLKS